MASVPGLEPDSPDPHQQEQKPEEEPPEVASVPGPELDSLDSGKKSRAATAKPKSTGEKSRAATAKPKSKRKSKLQQAAESTKGLKQMFKKKTP